MILIKKLTPFIIGLEMLALSLTGCSSVFTKVEKYDTKQVKLIDGYSTKENLIKDLRTLAVMYRGAGRHNDMMDMMVTWRSMLPEMDDGDKIITLGEIEKFKQKLYEKYKIKKNQ